MFTQEALSNALSSCRPLDDQLHNIEIAKFHKSKIQLDVTTVLAEIFPACIIDQIITRLLKTHMMGQVLPQLQRRLIVKAQTIQNREAFRRTRIGRYCYNYEILRIMSGLGSINPEMQKPDIQFLNYTPTWCELGRIVYPNLGEEDDDE